MSRLEVTLLGQGDTAVIHVTSGTRLRTSKSPAYGGSGASFSSTDLVGAALGSCIATNVEPVAGRHGISVDRIRVRIDKSLSVRPKRLNAFDVTISVRGAVPDDVLLRFDRAAQHCLVHESLAEHVAVRIRVEREDGQPVEGAPETVHSLDGKGEP
jgi:putative redox protein